MRNILQTMSLGIYNTNCQYFIVYKCTYYIRNYLTLIYFSSNHKRRDFKDFKIQQSS